jgi:phosphatidate phosphatase APP1
MRMVREGKIAEKRLKKATSVATYADLSPTLGRWNRLRVRGRILSVERVEPRHQVTPFQDVGARFLADQIVEVSILDSAGQPASERYAARTDHFGFFEVLVTLLQPVDSRTALTARTFVGDRILAGTGNCFVLPDEDSGPILVSDVDKTYLESIIRSPRDIVRMMARPGKVRRPLPGMPAFTAALTRWPHGVPLIFLSGTPFFFKRSLEDRFCRDELTLTGLYLRPPSPPIEKELTTDELARFLDSLHYQFGFKVLTILQLLKDLPDRVELLLWGDDNQHDPQVYATISGWLEGTLTAGQVLDLADRYQTLPQQRDQLAAILAYPPRGQKVRQIAIRDVTKRQSSWPDQLISGAAHFGSATELAAILAKEGLTGT